MSEEIVWDGRHYPYIPPADLRIAPSLTLHDDVDATVDPVTHEVLRHALWNVNTEHGNTIMKISGSPICAYGHDFNPCILDERGDFVFFGPFLQYLSAAVGNAVKWTLENRSDEPGHRRRRHVAVQRPVDRGHPPVRRGGDGTGLPRRAALLLGRQHAAPVGPRRHRPRRASTRSPRTSSGSRRASRRSRSSRAT